MLKLVVVGSDPAERSELARMATAVSRSLPAADVRVVHSHGGPTHAHELDAALFERPLADLIVVLGRPGRTSVSGIRSLCEVVHGRWDVAALTRRAGAGSDIEDVIELGGAFRSGPLCQAGGFVGDGRTPLDERLRALGFRSLVLRDAFDPAVALDPLACSA